jgi:hypothetical protein
MTSIKLIHVTAPECYQRGNLMESNASPTRYSKDSTASIGEFIMLKFENI